MKRTVYIVEYGDRACSNFLGVFSTREQAEDFLKPYKELENIYGKKCVEGFYPDIMECVLDKFEELKFIREVDRFRNSYDNQIAWYTELFGVESDEETYRTFTLDAEKALEEAIEYFKTVDNTEKEML